MGFTLKHLRTGEIRTFSTKEVLEMLGDLVNDEIIRIRSLSNCFKIRSLLDAEV